MRTNLILDRHPVHHLKKVRDFAQSTQGRLKPFILPPYSPELNLNEQVWNYIKDSQDEPPEPRPRRATQKSRSPSTALLVDADAEGAGLIPSTRNSLLRPGCRVANGLLVQPRSDQYSELLLQ